MILVIAILGGLALVILLFCLGFTGLVGSYHEQKSAVEAASLAAAKDLSAIVIEDPNFGFVGLSDASPNGTATAAGDNFYTPVTGINTLLGTIRLDLIIADVMGDPVMKQLALADYRNAMTAQASLVTALQNAAALNGTGKDAKGHVLNPTQDAINAYQANSVHLAIGQTSSLVPGSLHLSLGFVDGLGCRTPVPQPAAVASLPSDDMQVQGFYAPNVDVSYGGKAFVFAALAANSTLVDWREFQNNLADLPYATPSIIKVDAQEQYLQNGTAARIVNASAAAMAGTIVDQRPNPGFLTMTFPNGGVPELASAANIITNVQLNSDPVDSLQSPADGDYPESTLGTYSMPYLPDVDSSHPQFSHVLSVALYDWLRRAGTNVNVDSLVSVLQTSFSGGTTPKVYRLAVASSGELHLTEEAWNGQNLAVSHKQFRGTTGLGLFSSNKSVYDVQLTDFCRQPGRVNGGKHAGEPLNVPGQAGNNPSGAAANNSMYENTTLGYQEFLTGSGVRPTYSNQGVAVDITFRRRN